MALAEPKQERRQQIMEAAKEVFAEAGYHGASINAIIEKADIARGTFYLYFESKAAVFDSILDQAMADLRARLESKAGAAIVSILRHDALIAGSEGARTEIEFPPHRH